MRWSPRVSFLIEHLDLPAATDDPDARWEEFQIRFLNNESLFAIDSKCRQAGWSWISAADAVAAGVLAKRQASIFVSINLEEAAEKIRYAKQVMAALDRDVRPRLVIDNKFELEFDNGSRLISHPCRPVRGKARARVYLDEFAHYPREREIYTAAVPVTTKGGTIRIGSTPLGASGLFWEIDTQTTRAYPAYRRQRVPWWAVQGLCRDVTQAALLAPAMTTIERVRLFGTARLVEIFENVPLDDFQQEYECAYLDEATAWIAWETIKQNQIDAAAGRLWHRQARSVDEALRVLDEVALACRDGTIEGALAGGMDIGRKKDLSELTFVGKPTTAQLPYRLGISLFATEFDDQMAVASKALDVLPVTQFLIDQNGIGMQLAESLHKRFGARAEGVDFTNATKELWSVELKVQMQRGATPIPLERDLAYQIHSIKKKLSASKHAVFDPDANATHHADKYWALALAVWAAGGARRTPAPASSARVVKASAVFG